MDVQSDLEKSRSQFGSVDDALDALMDVIASEARREIVKPAVRKLIFKEWQSRCRDIELLMLSLSGYVELLNRLRRDRWCLSPSTLWRIMIRMWLACLDQDEALIDRLERAIGNSASADELLDSENWKQIGESLHLIELRERFNDTDSWYKLGNQVDMYDLMDMVGTLRNMRQIFYDLVSYHLDNGYDLNVRLMV